MKRFRFLVVIGHATCSHYLVLAMIPAEICCGYVNLMKADIARRVHHVVIGTHDIY